MNISKEQEQLEKFVAGLNEFGEAQEREGLQNWEHAMFAAELSPSDIWPGYTGFLVLGQQVYLRGDGVWQTGRGVCLDIERLMPIRYEPRSDLIDTATGHLEEELEGELVAVGDALRSGELELIELEQVMGWGYSHHLAVLDEFGDRSDYLVELR